MDIKYKITFYSDWHCGSGLSSGADLDLLVIKDQNGLPFVPGKTIKGLLREAVVDIANLSGNGDEAKINELFGLFDSKEKAEKGLCFFTNAIIKEDLGNAIKDAQIQEYLFNSIASTAIDENGIAEAHSLRKMQVCVPCKLEGQILDVPGDCQLLLENGLKYIKRLGQNRNRGLGRCTFSIIENEKGGQA